MVQEKFRIIPITPKDRKHPGWKLGSGFDGITLEPSRREKAPAVRRRKAGRERNFRFPVSPLPKLELSTRLPQTRHCLEAVNISKTQKGQGGLIETETSDPISELGTADDLVNGKLIQRTTDMGRIATSAKEASSMRLSRETIEDLQSKTSGAYSGDNQKKLIQPHPSQSKDSDASWTIRGPSKSEKNGWLKRKTLNYPINDEDEDARFFLNFQASPINASRRESHIDRGRHISYTAESKQAQHAAYTDLCAFVGSGQTRSNLEQPATSRKQVRFQDKPRSEQHQGWDLQMANRKGFGSEEEIHDQQSSNTPPKPRQSSISESDFPSSAFSPRNVLIPKARPHAEVPRTSEIPETQDGTQDSIQIDPVNFQALTSGQHTSYLAETTLNSGDYFSKACRQLEYPGKISHTIMRRRSRRESFEKVVGGPQVSSRMQIGAPRVGTALFIVEQSLQYQQGSLQLGVTPRLKRRMS